jgi:endogenous inhibitor of DNA gyrase (YacG/DUF329 family)
MKKTFERYTCNHCGRSSEMIDIEERDPRDSLEGKGWTFTYIPSVQLCPTCSKSVRFEEQVIVLDGKRFRITDWLYGRLDKPL